MKLFDHYIEEFQQSISTSREQPQTSYEVMNDCNWNKLPRGCLVLENETAVELGHPSKESLSLLMFTSTPSKVNADKITLVGKELKDLKNSPVSFAKILMVEIDDIKDDQDAYDKFREIDRIRHTINLEGYMLRAALQNAREWSRVSRAALEKGFSFHRYGSELIHAYKNLSFVKKAEIIFITENEGLIRSLKPMAEKTVQITQALNKIFDNLEFDCDACSFQDVCDEIEGLKEMHKTGLRSKPAGGQTG